MKLVQTSMGPVAEKANINSHTTSFAGAEGSVHSDSEVIKYDQVWAVSTHFKLKWCRCPEVAFLDAPIYSIAH